MVNPSRHRSRHRALLFSKPSGLTLIELLVVLVILSIMAVVAIPFAEVTVKRHKEMSLRVALREIRTAIDHFHDDWKQGKISKTSPQASEFGYPLSLNVLVEGVEHSSSFNVQHKYLRRIPANPFAEAGIPVHEQWQYRSYQDSHDTNHWGGQDVYDVSVKTNRKALDGSDYKNW